MYQEGMFHSVEHTAQGMFHSVEHPGGYVSQCGTHSLECFSVEHPAWHVSV